MIDRFSLGWENSAADGASYFTQNLSGVYALCSLLLLSAFLYFSKRLSQREVFGAFLIDLSILLQTIGWNGVFTELSHFISQRPRPFVFLDPLTRGLDPSHFTSFYSGHTSFSAAATLGVILMLFRRKAPPLLCFLSIAIAEVLIFSTAYFRILAGRHFLTDVLSGGVAGTAIACLLGFFYRDFVLPPLPVDGPRIA